ncbi:restriction endonuclease subunit S [Escherichia coli]|uniref:restriction endonuclease subunit S n=1 Tax=Escherichia coli TaxID=562 RepID=UPI001E59C4F8|nr:restriction endonuclease subunit S [Escherichia coli]
MKLKPGWRHVKLSDIAKIKSGSTPLRAEGERYFSTAGTPWVKTLDLNNGEIISTDEKITDTALLETSCSVFPVGTVLVAMYGGFNQIGRTGLLTIPAAINQALSGLILDRDKAEPAYILNYLNGNVKLWKKFAASSRKDPNITRDDVCGFPVLLPPLAEQKKIAKILSTWDNAISVTEKLLTNSQQQKKALMQQLLTGKKRLLDENGVRFSGEWEVVRLKQLIHEEKKRNRDNHIQRVLSVTNHSGFVLPEEQFSKRVASEDVSTYKIVKKNQYGYNPSRLNVGSFARLDNYDEGVLSPMYVVFSINHERLNSDYFLNWMSSNEAKQRIAGSTQGSVRDSVGFDALCSFSFSLPTLMEQQKIAAVLSAADAEMSMLEKKLACLKEEKKALMQQLLTGKRRVKVESEETVSA